MDPQGTELQRYQVVRERLVQEFPNTDDETFRDTLEGITDLHEMIAAVVRSALVDEALQAGLRLRFDDMKERLSRLEVRSSKKRELALHAMNEAGLTKLEQPDFTASTRAGSPALIIVSEQAIPEAYWLPQSPKLDRQGLLLRENSQKEMNGEEEGRLTYLWLIIMAFLFMLYRLYA